MACMVEGGARRRNQGAWPASPRAHHTSSHIGDLDLSALASLGGGAAVTAPGGFTLGGLAQAGGSALATTLGGPAGSLVQSGLSVAGGAPLSSLAGPALSAGVAALQSTGSGAANDAGSVASAALKGLAVGATIGTAIPIPVIGTAAGAVVGAAAGAVLALVGIFGDAQGRCEKSGGTWRNGTCNSSVFADTGTNVDVDPAVKAATNAEWVAKQLESDVRYIAAAHNAGFSYVAYPVMPFPSIEYPLKNETGNDSRRTANNALFYSRAYQNAGAQDGSEVAVKDGNGKAVWYNKPKTPYVFNAWDPPEVSSTGGGIPFPDAGTRARFVAWFAANFDAVQDHGRWAAYREFLASQAKVAAAATAALQAQNPDMASLQRWWTSLRGTPLAVAVSGKLGGFQAFDTSETIALIRAAKAQTDAGLASADFAVRSAWEQQIGQAMGVISDRDRAGMGLPIAGGLSDAQAYRTIFPFPFVFQPAAKGSIGVATMPDADTVRFGDAFLSDMASKGWTIPEYAARLAALLPTHGADGKVNKCVVASQTRSGGMTSLAAPLYLQCGGSLVAALKGIPTKPGWKPPTVGVTAAAVTAPVAAKPAALPKLPTAAKVGLGGAAIAVVGFAAKRLLF